MNFADDFPDGVDVENEEDGVDEDDEIAVEDFVRVPRSHVAVADGGRCLEGPVDCVLVPDVPIGEALQQVDVVHRVGVGEPQLPCLEVVPALQIVVVVDAEVYARHPSRDEPNHRYGPQQLVQPEAHTVDAESEHDFWIDLQQCRCLQEE